MPEICSIPAVRTGPITPQIPHIAVPPIANRGVRSPEASVLPDSIRLRGIQLPVALGVSPGERALRRPVEIDLDLYCDLARSGASDDLAATLDYVAVWDVLTRIARAEFRLVEALAERLCAELLAGFP